MQIKITAIKAKYYYEERKFSVKHNFVSFHWKMENFQSQLFDKDKKPQHSSSFTWIDKSNNLKNVRLMRFATLKWDGERCKQQKTETKNQKPKKKTSEKSMAKIENDWKFACRWT